MGQTRITDKQPRVSSFFLYLLQRFLLLLFGSFLVSCVSFNYERMHGRTPLAETPASFWSKAQTVAVTVRGLHREINATEYTGTSINLPQTIFEAGFFGLGSLAMHGPKREDRDLDFDREINRRLGNFSWKPGEYFAGLLRQQLDFSDSLNVNFITDLKSSQEFSSCTDSESRSCIKVNFYFNMDMVKDLTNWSEPGIILLVGTTIMLADRDTEQRIHDYFASFHKGRLTSTSEWEELRRPKAYNLSSSQLQELERAKPHQGSYHTHVLAKTDFFKKEQWLSDNGRFLEEQYALLLQKIAIEAGKAIMQAYAR